MSKQLVQYLNKFLLSSRIQRLSNQDTKHVPSNPELVQKMIDQLPNKSGTVLELGSGTGSAAILLANAGFDVYGFDNNPLLLFVSLELAESSKKNGSDHSDNLHVHLGEYTQDEISGEIMSVLASRRIMPADFRYWYMYPWHEEVDLAISLFKKKAGPKTTMVLNTDGHDNVNEKIDDILGVDVDARHAPIFLIKKK